MLTGLTPDIPIIKGTAMPVSTPNRLINEKNPYLQQHAFNPVDWHPWGPEALSRARTENKPVLLSIGYSTCHWCHVMEHESFSDQTIATLMNQHFICIKVAECFPDPGRPSFLRGNLFSAPGPPRRAGLDGCPADHCWALVAAGTTRPFIVVRAGHDGQPTEASHLEER